MFLEKLGSPHGINPFTCSGYDKHAKSATRSHHLVLLQVFEGAGDRIYIYLHLCRKLAYRGKTLILTVFPKEYPITDMVGNLQIYWFLILEFHKHWC